jgi:hypothetical protein
MVLPPQVPVERAGATTILNSVTPIFSGSSDTRGVSVTSVTTRGSGVNSVLGTVPTFVYEMETSYPSAWADFFVTELGAVGIASGTEYTATVLSERVRLTVYGSSGTPTTHDVQVNLQRYRRRVSV